jgi:hypothetical protein
MESKAITVTSKPLPLLVQEVTMADSVINLTPIQDSEPKFEEPRQKIPSKLVRKISHAVKKLEIAKNSSPKLSKSISYTKGQFKPSEKASKMRKGMISIILALSAYGLFTLGIILAVAATADLLAFILIGLALAAVISAIIMGLKSIFSPKDKQDWILGSIGIALSITPFILLLMALFLL